MVLSAICRNRFDRLRGRIIAVLEEPYSCLISHNAIRSKLVAVGCRI